MKQNILEAFERNVRPISVVLFVGIAGLVCLGLITLERRFYPRDPVVIVKKNYSLQVYYMSGDSEIVDGITNCYQDELVSFKVESDSGVECLYVSKDAEGFGPALWEKVCCGVRRYQIIYK